MAPASAPPAPAPMMPTSQHSMLSMSQPMTQMPMQPPQHAQHALHPPQTMLSQAAVPTHPSQRTSQPQGIGGPVDAHHWACVSSGHRPPLPAAPPTMSASVVPPPTFLTAANPGGAYGRQPPLALGGSPFHKGTSAQPPLSKSNLTSSFLPSALMLPAK